MKETINGVDGGGDGCKAVISSQLQTSVTRSRSLQPYNRMLQR